MSILKLIGGVANDLFCRRSLDAVARGFRPRLHSPLVSLLAGVLRKGEADGVFRTGVDPVQLYISIAGVCYFYMSNADTLSTVFATNLRAQGDPGAPRTRRRSDPGLSPALSEAYSPPDVPTAPAATSA